MDGATLDAKISGGKTASWLAWSGSGLGRYLPLGKEQNPNFDIVGVPWPTVNKGETPLTGQKDNPYLGGGSAAITTGCDEVEIAAKWLDYGYGEEGHLLFNFGIEGESYEMINGYPTYTEAMTNNPDGLPMAQALAQYVRATYSGQFIQDRRYQEQYAQFPQQVAALETWGGHQGKLIMPPVTPTPEESERLAFIMNEVNTYKDEMYTKFVMGEVSLDKFDDFVAEIESMNIEEAISIQQAALDRYNAR